MVWRILMNSRPAEQAAYKVRTPATMRRIASPWRLARGSNLRIAHLTRRGQQAKRMTCASMSRHATWCYTKSL